MVSFDIHLYEGSLPNFIESQPTMAFCLHKTHLAEDLLTASRIGNDAEDMDSELC